MPWKIDRLKPVCAKLLGFHMRAALAAMVFSLLFSAAPVTAAEAPSRCVDSSRAGAGVTLAGKLTLVNFAGQPNDESAVRRDAGQRALILELPRHICFDDGEFADGSERFDRVHVHATDKRLTKMLQDAVGRDVTVSGTAMGAHTAHHRAPMILLVKSVTVR